MSQDFLTLGQVPLYLIAIVTNHGLKEKNASVRIGQQNPVSVRFAELEIRPDDLVVTGNTSIVRGYNTTVPVAIPLTNLNTTFGVTPLSGARLNFDLSVYLPNTTADNPTVFADTSLFSQPQLQQALEKGGTSTIAGDVTVLVPRETCVTYTAICVEIVPATNASYSHPAGYVGNRFCMDATSYVNCLGRYLCGHFDLEIFQE